MQRPDLTNIFTIELGRRKKYRRNFRYSRRRYFGRERRNQSRIHKIGTYYNMITHLKKRRQLLRHRRRKGVERRSGDIQTQETREWNWLDILARKCRFFTCCFRAFRCEIRMNLFVKNLLTGESIFNLMDGKGKILS